MDAPITDVDTGVGTGRGDMVAEIDTDAGSDVGFVEFEIGAGVVVGAVGVGVGVGAVVEVVVVVVIVVEAVVGAEAEVEAEVEAENVDRTVNKYLGTSRRQPLSTWSAYNCVPVPRSKSTTRGALVASPCLSRIRVVSAVVAPLAVERGTMYKNRCPLRFTIQ